MTVRRDLQWEIINPEGVVKTSPFKPASRPSVLEGSTIALRWNGKSNGDLYLKRAGELLAEAFGSAKVVMVWEQRLSTASISQSPRESAQVAAVVSAMGADLVVAASGD